MPLVNRFSTVQKGGITFTGNTLGLAGNLANPAPLPAGVLPGPQPVDTIGAFTTTNNALQVPGGWPPGTTLNYLLNASAANLTFPSGSTVLYAELIWAGCALNADQNVLADLNNSVLLTTPAGTTPVFPDPATASLIPVSSSGNTYYVRSQNVTALVQAGGTGTYTLGRVPGALGNSINNAPPGNFTPQNFLGWCLEVVYKNINLPVRNMDIWVDDAFINSGSPPLDVTISDLATPITGIPTGKLFLFSGEGDASITGDQALFGPDTSHLTVLGNPVLTPNPNPGTTPNNPQNNFFGSQINGDNGLLDTSGTFGSANQNSFTGTNFAAARQGIDITAIDVTSTLKNNQTSAVIELTTIGDAYGNLGIGLQIDAYEPIFTPMIKSVDKSIANVGDIINYTTTFTNTSIISANNVVFTDIPPVGSSFVSGTVKIDDVLQPITVDPTLGIIIGTVIPNQTVKISFDAVITSLPPTPPLPPTLNNDSKIDYTFEPVPGTILNGTKTSNLVPTQVELPTLDINKSVNKSVANLGELITYTVTLTNTGILPINNIFFQDPVPAGTTYANSLSVDTVFTGSSPQTGLTITTIIPNQTVTIRWQVQIGTVLPFPNPIENSGTITIPELTPVQTNTVTTAVIDINKAVNKTFANVGEVITYTVTIRNPSTSTANNVLFTDPVPAGTTYNGNLTVSTGYTGTNPQTGITITTINPGQTVTISWQVKINATVPVPNPILNTGTVTIPNGTPTSTNTVATTVLQNSKSVDKAFANVGEVITYTVTINNPGTSTVNNVLFTDTIPTGTTYNGNLTVNTGYTGTNPQTGITITAITAGQTVTISWQIKIGAIIPVPNPVPNAGIVTIPNGTPTPTNTVTTTVLQNNKSVNKLFANIGEVITYTVSINNPSTNAVNNVLFLDLIPPGTTYNNNLIVNTGYSGTDPQTGITITTIGPGETATISWQVKIGDSIPFPNPISNTGSITINDGTPTPTNTATTQVNNANVTLEKNVDKLFADLGDILTYTIIATNTGNIAANNVLLTDSTPSGTNFINGSVTVHGGSQSTANPNTGISIGTINPGDSIPITFKVQINSATLPTPNPVPNTASITYNYIVNPQQAPINGTSTSNTVYTAVSSSMLRIVKSSDKSNAVIDDTVTYTLVGTNIGNIAANSVIFIDPLPSGTTFIPNSVTIGGISKPGLNPNTGIPAGTLAFGDSVIITFKIIVTSIPTPNPTLNIATANFQYQPDPSRPAKNGTANSNIVPLSIVNPQLSITKTSDTECVTIGGEINYIITVTNTGSVDASNVIVTDPPPLGTRFENGSVAVDGISQPNSDPSLGINLGTIIIGQSKTITFEVYADHPPIPKVITNGVTVSFNYNPDPYTTSTYSFSTGTISSINVNANYFTQISVMENLLIPDEKPDVNQINDIDIDVKIMKKTVIVTPQSSIDPTTGLLISSIEGKYLTGRKLLLQGQLCQKITYIADDASHSVHSVDFVKPFSAFIVVPKMIDLDPYTTLDSLGINFNVNALIEDVYSNLVSPRKIFKNVTLFLQASPSNVICPSSDICLTDSMPITINGVCTPEELSTELSSFDSCGSPLDNLRWTQVIIPETFTLPATYPGIEDIMSVDACVEIISQKVIPTPVSSTVTTNHEGTTLTGRKLIVEGFIRQKVIYTANNTVQSTHAIDFDVPFSAFIVLATTDSLSSQFIIDACIENIYIEKINATTIAKQVTLFIKAIPIESNNYGSCIGSPTTSTSLANSCPATDGGTCGTNVVCGCGMPSNIKVEGLCDVNTIIIKPSDEGLGSWRQVSIMDTATVPTLKPNIESLSKVYVNVKILSQKMIDTPSGTNLNGMHLTGKKLVIEGVVSKKIVYTAALPSQPIHSFHSSQTFSEFIILPDDANGHYCVDACVEDVFVLPLDCRNVFSNVTLFLQARSRTISCRDYRLMDIFEDEDSDLF